MVLIIFVSSRIFFVELSKTLTTFLSPKFNCCSLLVLHKKLYSSIGPSVMNFFHFLSGQSVIQYLVLSKSLKIANITCSDSPQESVSSSTPPYWVMFPTSWPTMTPTRSSHCPLATEQNHSCLCLQHQYPGDFTYVWFCFISITFIVCMVSVPLIFSI